MTIAQFPTNNTTDPDDAFTFLDITSHGTIYADPWEFEDSDEVFYGVQGMQQTTDKVHGRWLRMPIDLYGASTEADLRTGINSINAQINELKGPLIINSTMTYNNCVFKGLMPGMPIQYMGGGASEAGWASIGMTLVWRQLKP